MSSVPQFHTTDITSCNLPLCNYGVENGERTMRKALFTFAATLALTLGVGLTLLYFTDPPRSAATVLDQ